MFEVGWNTCRGQPSGVNIQRRTETGVAPRQQLATTWTCVFETRSRVARDRSSGHENMAAATKTYGLSEALCDRPIPAETHRARILPLSGGR